MKIRKRYLFLTAIGILLLAIGYLAFYKGIPFSEDISPDRHFIVRSYQIFDTWDSIRYIRDSDSAHGYIRLFDASGKQLNQTFSEGLTFLIVVWKDKEVEIQCDATIRWRLPNEA